MSRYAAVILTCSFVSLGGCGQQAERERLAAILLEKEELLARHKVGEVQHQQKLAELQRNLDSAQREKLEWQVKGRLWGVAAAYADARQKLGHPPQGADQLRPFLRNADDLLGPRDQQPFSLAWGAIDRPGTLLAWETTADADGGRWILVPIGLVLYVKADDFETRQKKTNTSPPPAAAAVKRPPPPRVVITVRDPETGKVIESDPGPSPPR